MNRKFFAAKRVLVTGGAGFLGSNLCDRLLADGHEVVCVDNFATGSRRNILHLLDNPHFSVLEQDVTNPVYVQVDEIYNLACPASPVHYQYDPVHTMKTSVLGAINVLGLAKRLNAPVLQASTSEVYGDPEVHPQPESYWGRVNPNGIRSCYDEGKRSAETLFFDYRRRHVYSGVMGAAPFQSLYERDPGTLISLPLMTDDCSYGLNILQAALRRWDLHDRVCFVDAKGTFHVRDGPGWVDDAV